MKMDIKVGNTYRLRNGEKVTVQSIDYRDDKREDAVLNGDCGHDEYPDCYATIIYTDSDGDDVWCYFHDLSISN